MPAQPFGPRRSAGGANGQHLGMGGRIIQLARAVARLGHDSAISCDDDRAHGYFAAGSCGAGLF